MGILGMLFYIKNCVGGLGHKEDLMKATIVESLQSVKFLLLKGKVPGILCYWIH